MRFSNERGKFTPVQKKNKGAFKRLLNKQQQQKNNIQFPLRNPSL